MLKISIPPLLLVTAVSACGGGSGGGSGSDGIPSRSALPSVETLATFDDGAGVVRVTAEDNGEIITATTMGPDVANAEFDELATVNFTNQQYVGSNAYGDFYTAEAVINGTTVFFDLYEDSSGETAMAYAEGGGANALIAGGGQVSNIPSGTYTYRGTNVIGTRDGDYSEDGTFAMAVNFDSGIAQLDGRTESTYISADSISVNSATGEFRDSDMTVGVIDGDSMPGTIYGTFHGSGATGVTGLYHDNAGTPEVAGAIAGTR